METASQSCCFAAFFARRRCRQPGGRIFENLSPWSMNPMSVLRITADLPSVSPTVASRTERARLRAIRQIYLALWTLYVWARAADNIEAAYLCSEWAVLISWPFAIKDYLTGKSKEANQLNQSFIRLVALHNTVADDYLSHLCQTQSQDTERSNLGGSRLVVSRHQFENVQHYRTYRHQRPLAMFILQARGSRRQER